MPILSRLEISIFLQLYFETYKYEADNKWWQCFHVCAICSDILVFGPIYSCPLRIWHFFYFERTIFCPCIHDFKEFVFLLFNEVVYQIVSIVNHFPPHSASCIVMLLVMPFSTPSDYFESLRVDARIGVNEVKPIIWRYSNLYTDT